MAFTSFLFPQEVMKILQFYFPGQCLSIYFDLEAVDYVAGEDDRTLMRLQSMGGGHVSLDRKHA